MWRSLQKVWHNNLLLQSCLIIWVEIISAGAFLSTYERIRNWISIQNYLLFYFLRYLINSWRNISWNCEKTKNMKASSEFCSTHCDIVSNNHMTVHGKVIMYMIFDGPTTNLRKSTKLRIHLLWSYFAVHFFALTEKLVHLVPGPQLGKIFFEGAFLLSTVNSQKCQILIIQV